MSTNPNLIPVKKRKKHAPDRQQPEWLFPADSENPALKPHKQPTLQEKLDKQASIDFLTRRAVGAPMKPAPPVQLLNLIGSFLAEYGFTSTGRLFSTERQGRSKLDGWKNDTGGKLEKGMPTLGKIYKEWRKEWEERRLLEMTSSDEEDDAATKREKMLARKEKVEKKMNKARDDATSSSGPSDSVDSNSEMHDARQVKRSSVKKSRSASGASTSSATSSDSDADDEKEVPAAKFNVQKSKQNNLKRKASTAKSSSPASESSSSSEDDTPKLKKIKTSPGSGDKISSNKDGQTQKLQKRNTSKKAEPSSSESSSSTNSDSGSESESESESSGEIAAKKIPLSASSLSDSSSDSSSEVDDSSSDGDNKKKKPLQSSDTSATLSDGPSKVSPTNLESNSSSNDSVAASKTTTATSKTKLAKESLAAPAAMLQRKTNVPFSRVPKDTKVDEKLASNAYIPYDYAQKAHEDLIVTKGKNFTKEKNKKKRGSYKGGYIDVDGKKGIKFDE